MLDQLHDDPAARPYRAAFFRALDAHAPAVLRSLKELLPADDGEVARSFHRSRSLRNYPEDVRVGDRAQAKADRERWQGELRRWAARWHMAEPWAIYAAEEQLELRRILLGTQDDPPATWHAPGLEPPLGCAFIWHPCHETWPEFVAGVLGRLDRYRADRLAQLAGEGVRGPRPVPARQFAWLAKYQCLGQSIARIAREERVGRATVRAALRDVADLVGLQLRAPSRGGAPLGAEAPAKQLRFRLAA